MPITQIRRGEEPGTVAGRRSKARADRRPSGGRAHRRDRAAVADCAYEPTFERAGASAAIATWLTVRSDLMDGVQVRRMPLSRSGRRSHSIVDNLPAGYRIEEAVRSKSDKANGALVDAPAMIAVTLLLLMIQLQSFSPLFMVFGPGRWRSSAGAGAAGLPIVRLRRAAGRDRALVDDHAPTRIILATDRPGHRARRLASWAAGHRGRDRPAPLAPCRASKLPRRCWR